MPKSTARGSRRKRSETTGTPSATPADSRDSATPNASDQEDDEVAALKTALEEANERFMRASAEVENIRRRAERQVEEAHKFALEKFAKELLGVQDSLDQAMQIELDDSAAEVVAPMREGISLIARQFNDTLERFSINAVAPAEGDPFDPELHQAISTQVQPKVPPGQVLHVIQKGFLLKERLLRPALVVVSSESG